LRKKDENNHHAAKGTLQNANKGTRTRKYDGRLSFISP